MPCPFVGPRPHGYYAGESPVHVRVVRQGHRHLTGQAEPTITLEDDKTLWCTPQGQVSTLENTRTVFWYTRDKSQELAKAARQRQKVTRCCGPMTSVLKLPAEYAPVDQPLQEIRPFPPAPPFRILRSTKEDGYPLPYACTYAVVTEPGIMALVYWLTKESWESRPPRKDPDAAGRAILYVAHRSSDAELRQEPLIREVHAERAGVTRVHV